MPIQYYLLENRLTDDPNDYRAQVIPSRTAEMKDVIQRMIERGSTVTKADILSVLEDFYGALQSMLAEGASVLTPFANFRSGMRGVFANNTDGFDASRHQIRPLVNAGRDLRSFYRTGLSPERIEAGVSTPTLLEFIDHQSGERNSVLSPGGMASLSGHRLKIDTADKNQGIVFIADDGTETPVQVIGHNKPSKLMFTVPDTLTAGEYTLQVRTSEIGELAETLTVAG